MHQKIIITKVLLTTTLSVNWGSKPALAKQLSEGSQGSGVPPTQSPTNSYGSYYGAVILAIIAAGVVVGIIVSRANSGLRLRQKSSVTTPNLPEPTQKPTPEISLAPNATTLNLGSTASLSIKGKNHQEVIAEFDAAIRRNPNSAELYGERGNFRKKHLADKRGAIEDYTQAIKINPHNALLYFWRSQTYHDLGCEQKAIEDYNEAMRLAPDNTLYYCFPSSTKSGDF